MAHIPPLAAIFSPSVARLASSAAKDWNSVDSWLASKFPGRSPPPFERNAETLKTLVALASLNESVDEDDDLVAAVESSALKTLNSSDARNAAEGHVSNDTSTRAASASRTDAAESIVTAIEESLSPNGHSAFDSLASAAVDLGVAFPEPAVLGYKIAGLEARLFRLEQALARMDVLREHVQDQASWFQELLETLESDGYRPAASLAKLNLGMQRKVRAGTARLQDSKEKTAVSGALPETTVEQLQEDEAVFLELLAYKKTLDKQLKDFQGLSPDKDVARTQLEALRTELYSATQRRDVVFESLVERSTPKRPTLK